MVDPLNILVRTSDGFEIASADLAQRGPGELTGSRQHGLPDWEMAGLLGDTRTLAQAREDAFELVAQDPDLREQLHGPLKRYLARQIQRSEDWTL